MANSTRSLLPGFTATFEPYCSFVSTSSSRRPSCTSPQVPLVFTLVSTRRRSPTPAASSCISPRPLWTDSRRSDTNRKDSPSRFSRVLCSFSSTVLRMSSRRLPFSSRSASSWVVRVAVNWVRRCSKLVSRSFCASPAASVLVRCWVAKFSREVRISSRCSRPERTNTSRSSLRRASRSSR